MGNLPPFVGEIPSANTKEFSHICSFNGCLNFEIRGDSISPNDTSWFTLAVQCVSCSWKDSLYDVETP
jgi:hypothetical protein